MRFLILFSGVAIFSGCGRYADTLNRLQPGGTTEVKFAAPRVQNERGEIMSLATLNGGVMIYAVNANEQFRRGARKLANETLGGATTWSIPTASYIFFAIGYQGANMQLANPMHCGQTGPITLNGTPITIQLTLDQNNCGSPPFVQPGFNNGNQPQPLYVATCSAASTVTMGISCGTPTGAGMVSVSVSMPEYWGFDGQIAVVEGPGNNLESGCATPLSAGTPLTLNTKVPTGGLPPADPFVMGVNSFNNPGCTGQTTKFLYGLGRGLGHAGNTSFSQFSVNGNPVNPSLNPIVFGTSAGNSYIYLRDL